MTVRQGKGGLWHPGQVSATDWVVEPDSRTRARVRTSRGWPGLEHWRGKDLLISARGQTPSPCPLLGGYEERAHGTSRSLGVSGSDHSIECPQFCEELEQMPQLPLGSLQLTSQLLVVDQRSPRRTEVGQQDTDQGGRRDEIDLELEKRVDSLETLLETVS